jgi:hypothetical protein
MGSNLIAATVRAEPVEALSLRAAERSEGRFFDRLRTNGG